MDGWPGGWGVGLVFAGAAIEDLLAGEGALTNILCWNDLSNHSLVWLEIAS